MKIAKLLVGLCCAELFFYLLGAFTSASFDISTWDMGIRAFTAFIGLLCGIPVAALGFAEIEK